MGSVANNEIAIACVDDCRVLANLRPYEQARIVLGQMPQQRLQVLEGKFADWQDLLSLAASHAMLIFAATAIFLSMGASDQ